MIALPAPSRAWVLTLGSAALLAACGAGALPVRVQLAVVLPAVIVFGLPHGAADWFLAAKQLPRFLPVHRLPIWILVFGVFYGVVCAAAVLSIHLAPLATLVAFIAASAWHFGGIDVTALGLNRLSLRAAAFGLLPIAAPLLFRGTEAVALLASLGVVVSPAGLRIVAAALVAIALSAAVSIAWARPARAASLLGEAAGMLALAAAAPPLLAFLIYFCGVHAPRQAAGATRGAAWIAWLTGLAAALLIGAAFLATPFFNGPGAAGQAVAVRALFWGLAILTFPHVLCNWLLAPTPTLSGERIPI